VHRIGGDSKTLRYVIAVCLAPVADRRTRYEGGEAGIEEDLETKYIAAQVDQKNAITLERSTDPSGYPDRSGDGMDSPTLKTLAHRMGVNPKDA
jgi:hypothetical protein